MNKNRQLKKKHGSKLIVATFLVFLAFTASMGDTYANETSRAASSVEQIMTQKKVSMKISNKSLRFIITELQKMSGIGIAFKDEGDIDKFKSLSVDVKDVPVEQVINDILSSTDLNYKIVNNTITIAKKTPQTQPKVEKVHVTGIVVQAGTKTPLTGATVEIIETGFGAISDAEGKFVLNIHSNNTLRINYTGMKELIYNKPLVNNQNIVIELEPDKMAVGDVVVTGIFKKSKESYTGAVTTVTAKDLKMYKGANILRTLNNIDPGLNIVANNEFGSDPNRLPEINIRGNSSLPLSIEELNQGAKAQLNTPLIIMDGFEISLQKMMDFNDDEIESINILKDAAATAIYGSRGANGVIVIVTRAPEQGKLKVYFRSSVNIEMPDLSSYDLLNAREKLDFEYRVAKLYNHGRAETDFALKKKYNSLLKEVSAGVDTDWKAQPVRTGVGQRYNFRLDGGSQEFRWSTSLSYNNVKGAMKGSDKNTFSGSVSLSYNLKNLIFRNNTSITTNKGVNSKYGNFSDYISLNPYFRIHDEDGKLIKMYKNPDGKDIGNPLYNAQLNSVDSNDYIDVTNNFSMEWDIIDGLKAVGKLGLTKKMANSDLFYPANHTKFEDKKYRGGNYFRRGSYDYSDENTFNYDASVTINYSKIFNEKHQIWVGLDFSLLQRDSYSYKFQLEGYTNNRFDYLGSGNYYKEGKPDPGSESLSRSVGATFNTTYTYDNRYFADFSYRMDGSSQFGADKRFAPFYSVGFGWNIHREKFVEDLGPFNNLRLRASIGETGSQNFQAYQARTMYEYDTRDRYLGWTGAKLMGIGNENLEWQTTTQMNGGLDFALLENRISGSFDIYSKETSNLLSTLDLPLMHGFPSYTENVGKVKNRGFEALLTGYLVRNTTKMIFWSITGRLAHNKSEIAELSDAIKQQTDKAIKDVKQKYGRLLIEGDSQSSIYAVRSLGVDPSNGKELFLDKNGNVTYTWNPADRFLSGDTEPKYRGNVNSMFTYNNFTVNVSFAYHWGGQQLNRTLLDKVENVDFQNNLDRRVYEERWEKPGDVKRFTSIDNPGTTEPTTRFIQNDNMFSFQSASLSYRFDQKWIKDKMKIQSLELGCNMSDIFYMSTVKQERGTSYPFARRIEFSLSLLF